MSNVLVSVVMVTCNVERFLAESIESILYQTFHDFEFVIVDFGSTDNSKSIISRYASKDDRVKLHTIPTCGLGEARNAGYLFAKGRYIAIMDADDVSLPNRLLWEVDFMEKHPQTGVVGGGVEWINAHDESLRIAHHPAEDREIQSELLTHSVVWQPTALIRRNAFALVGGYRGAFAPAEDYDLWLRIAEHFEIANLQQVVLRYRFHPQQVSLRERQKQILGVLAAQASASFRRNGKPDPLDSVREITTETLVSLGIPLPKLQGELACHCENWIRHMSLAGEVSAALETGVDVLQSDLKHVKRIQLAELYLSVAQLYWRQRKFLSGLVAAGRAILIRPFLLARPLKRLVRRVWIGIDPLQDS